MLPDKEAASINAAIYRGPPFFKYITRGLLTFSFTLHFMPCALCTFKAVPPAEALTKRLDPGGVGKGGLSMSLEFGS